MRLGYKIGAAATRRSSGLLRVAEQRLLATSAGLGVIGVALVGLYLGQVLESRQMLVMIYGLLMLLGIAYAVSSRKPAVEATRTELPTRIRVGQTVRCEIALEARRRVSTLVLEETLAPELGHAVRVPVPVLPGGESIGHEYTFTAQRRGVYTVGPLMTEWSDPFGLTIRRQIVADAVEVIVHPMTEMVSDRVSSREWEDPPVRPPVSKPWPTGFEFYGMRDYVSGDDPRRIVWRATAKTFDPGTELPSRYFVRESEQGITDRVNVFLDTDVVSHSEGDPSETFETAVEAASSLGVQHLKDGFSVSLDVNSHRVFTELRGGPHRVEYLDEMARAQLEHERLATGLERLLTDPRRNAHNVVITPHLEPDTATRLRLLADRGAALVLVLVVGDTTDPATIHRAGGIGCSVVEVPIGAPLAAVFSQVMMAGVPR